MIQNAVNSIISNIAQIKKINQLAQKNTPDLKDAEVVYHGEKKENVEKTIEKNRRRNVENFVNDMTKKHGVLNLMQIANEKSDGATLTKEDVGGDK